MTTQDFEVVCRLSSLPQSDLNITKLVVLDDDLSFVWEDTWGIQGNLRCRQ